MTGLIGMKTYTVRVRASSSAGPGPWSGTASTDTAAGPPDAPDAPGLIPGNRELTVTWTAPLGNSPAAISDYDVQYTSDSGSIWREWNADSTSTARSVAITGLAEGVEFAVRIRAANASGESPWSSTASATTGAQMAPTAPTLTPGDRKLTVAWTAPADDGTAVDDYDVRCRRVGQESWARIFDGGSTGLGGPNGTDAADDRTDPIDFGDFGSDLITNGTVDGNGGVYKASADIDEIYLYLQADIDNLAEDLALSLRTSVSRPSGNLYASGTALASVAVSAAQYAVAKFNKILVGPIPANGYFWTAPERSAAFNTRFRRIYGIDLATTSTGYELDGLANGTRYEVQIRASNAHGDSAWSASATSHAGQMSTQTTYSAPKSGPCYVPEISKIDELRNKFRRYAKNHPGQQDQRKYPICQNIRHTIF